MVSKISQITLLRPMNHVTCRSTTSGAILVDIRSGECYELNKVGAELWSSLADGRSIGEAMEQIQSRYDVTAETVEADVTRICHHLLEAGLVSPAENKAP